MDTTFSLALSRVMRLGVASTMVGLAALPANVGLAQPTAAPDLLSPSFVVPEQTVQRTPAVLKFQARVSQARLPLGEAEFAQVEVHLLRGGARICTERFSGVRIHDGVLNLDIGQGMDCDLADTLRTSAELAFEVCLGNSGCLKPVALGTVPFAAKSNHAHHAEEAHRANVAVQCSYAHRVTADADLYVTKRVGQGYYEFHTPTRLDGLALNPQTQRGGFIQWTPVAADQDVLHLCARDGSTGTLRRLSRLLLHAEQSEVVGGLAVGGATTLSGLLTVVQDASLSANLQVAGNTALSGGLSVAGAANLGPVRVGALPTDAPTGELFVRGSAEFTGDATSRVVFQNDVEFRGSVALPPGNVVAGDSVNSAAIIDGTIGAADLAPNAVTSAAILDGTVQAADLAPNAVTTAALAPNSVTTEDMLNSAVTGAKIEDRTIRKLDIALGAVTGDEILDRSIRSVDIAPNEITANEIRNGALTRADMAPGTLGFRDIRFVTCPTAGPVSPSYTDCSCRSDEVVIAGGPTVTSGLVRESRPIGVRTWRVACRNDAQRRVDCNGFTMLCARFR